MKKDLFTQRRERIAEIGDQRGVYNVDGQKITVVDYAEFTHLDHVPPATWFIKDASGLFIYIHTSKRDKAQQFVDEEYGVGRYTVNASKIQKGKPLGEDSKPAFGTATRRGQKR